MHIVSAYVSPGTDAWCPATYMYYPELATFGCDTLLKKKVVKKRVQKAFYLWYAQSCSTVPAL